MNSTDLGPVDSAFEGDLDPICARSRAWSALLALGTEFYEGADEQNGQNPVDFGGQHAFSHEDVTWDADAAARCQRKCACGSNSPHATESNNTAEYRRRLWSESGESLDSTLLRDGSR